MHHDSKNEHDFFLQKITIFLKMICTLFKFIFKFILNLNVLFCEEVCALVIIIFESIEVFRKIVREGVGIWLFINLLILQIVID